MTKISDKVLGCIAKLAESATRDAMGYASRGGSYEPKMPEAVKNYKAPHKSKIEMIFDKLVK